MFVRAFGSAFPYALVAKCEMLMTVDGMFSANPFLPRFFDWCRMNRQCVFLGD